MQPGRRLGAERAPQHRLDRALVGEVGAARHLGDAVGDVVGDDGEGVGVGAVAPLQHGIGERREIDVGAAAGAVDDRLDAVGQREADRADAESARPASADAGAAGVTAGRARARAAVDVRRQPGQRRRVVALRLRRRFARRTPGRARPGRRGSRRRCRARARPASTSSIRSSRRPPRWRTESHAAPAAQTLPRCSRPDGVGASRPITSRSRSTSRSISRSTSRSSSRSCSGSVSRRTREKCASGHVPRTSGAITATGIA